jgi:hypothetical protein
LHALSSVCPVWAFCGPCVCLSVCLFFFFFGLVVVVCVVVGHRLFTPQLRAVPGVPVV